jgi:superfamily II DNA or RNA helicase
MHDDVSQKHTLLMHAHLLGGNRMTPQNSSIDNEINAIEQRLAELEYERNNLIQKRDNLVQQSEIHQKCKSNISLALPVNQKIELFKKLFKGRSDVFAKRWQNAIGRSGYSFSCQNEWVKNVCNKPRIKCNECPSRAYTALSDQIIYDHLVGKKIVGLYPLLADNTCYLLAVDFDDDDWQEATKALAQACRQCEVPHIIEISRSGNGAHLWIFFSQAVTARDARLLGFGLIDKAMEIHPNLSFDSYDRLFPNQDIMPEGGFGNLIALPLQKQARQNGNSLFVGQDLKVYADQWQHLSQVQTVSTKQLASLISKLTPDILRISDQRTIEAQPPWEQGAKLKSSPINNCPKQLTVVLANHVYFNLDEIPAPLTTRLKRLASFSNPVFFKTQAMRFSTHGIPRYITCAQIEQGPANSQWLSLPRGCIDDAIALLQEQSITVIIDDKRESGQKMKSLKFLGKLKKDQLKAVSAITKHNTGVLHAPTAFGKTVVAIGVISKRKVNTLILTHSRQLLEQWQERLVSFLNNAEIGIIGGGKKKPSGQIDIATYQSLINKKDNTIDPLIQDYGQIIIDECHHISAPRFAMVLNEVRAKFVLGLTATPDRQDGHQKIIFMLAGPIRHKVKSNHSEKFKQQVVVTKLNNQPPAHLINNEEKPRISDAYQWLMDDDARTRKIIDDIILQIADGRYPLVLTERRMHAENINKILLEKEIRSVILRGGMRAKERKAANEQLPNAQVIVATGKYVGEGFDLPRLDTLFLAMPIAWRGSLAQYAGRIHRESDGKDIVTIFDYVDASLPMLKRMFNKREKGYKAMNYQLNFINIDN